MGTYRGRRILKNRAEMPEPIRDTLEAVKLTILDGGRFELIDAGMPTSGSWSYEDGIGKFHIETQMGKAISDLGIGAEQRNITIEVRQLSDDVMEWYDAGSFDKSRIRLERVLPSER